MVEMTFEQKYDVCIDYMRSIAYNSYRSSEINRFADVVELLAIFNKESGVSKGDVEDFLYGENDNALEDDDENVNESENNDSRESFVNNIFQSLNDRVVLFADLYPFIIDNNIIYLKGGIQNREKNYIFLLISSMLDIFKKFQPILTTDFETVSYKAFKEYLPCAEVVPFGKNSKYIGNAKSKIKQLANDVGLPINKDEIDEIDERNNQERGLDIIGWLPFDDNCPNKVVFLGQCACGYNYEYKQYDTSRYENYYEFYKTHPQHTLFIPRILINIVTQKFYHSDCIKKGFLVFERKRIVSLLKNNDIINELNSKELVERCLADTSEYY